MLQNTHANINFSFVLTVKATVFSVQAAGPV